MQIQTENAQGEIILRIQGRLDTVSSPQFRAVIDGIDFRQYPKVTLDFTEVDYITSAGLRELLVLKKRLGSKPFLIANARQNILGVFRTTGFSGYFDFVDTATKSGFSNMSFRRFLLTKVRNAKDRVVLDADGREYTWDDILRRAQGIAADLQDLGVEQGTHVGICGVNSSGWIFTFYAVQMLGAIAVLMNFNLGAQEIITLSSVGDITHLCYGALPAVQDEEDFIRRVTGEGSMIRKTYAIGRSPSGPRPDAEKRAAAWLRTPVEPDDACVMIFTSGSTGTPKGVLYSAYNVLNAAGSNAASLHLSPEDRACLILPLFHIFGLVAGLFGNAIADSRLVIPENTRTTTLLNAIEEKQCTVFHAVPTMFLAMMNNPEFDPKRLSTLRSTILSGAPISETQMRTFRGLFPNDHFAASYGLSEMAPVSITDYDDTPEHIITTIGKPVSGIHVKISDPATGEALAPGKTGEIRIYGYNLMTGYYKAELDMQSIDGDGWLHTGDLGFIDDEGYLHFVSRLKELIIRGGENIIPNEIASALSEEDCVADVKVMGVPDEFWGEIVVAALLLKDGASFDEAAVRAGLAGKLAKFKIPAHFLIYGAFPTLPNGKVDAVNLKKDIIARVQALNEAKAGAK